MRRETQAHIFERMPGNAAANIKKAASMKAAPASFRLNANLVSVSNFQPIAALQDWIGGFPGLYLSQIEFFGGKFAVSCLS